MVCRLVSRRWPQGSQVQSAASADTSAAQSACTGHIGAGSTTPAEPSTSSRKRRKKGGVSVAGAVSSNPSSSSALGTAQAPPSAVGGTSAHSHYAQRWRGPRRGRSALLRRRCPGDYRPVSHPQEVIFPPVLFHKCSETMLRKTMLPHSSARSGGAHARVCICHPLTRRIFRPFIPLSPEGWP